MGRNRIIIGSLSNPLYTIEDNQIRSISETNALDIVGTELSADEMVAEISGDPNNGKLIAPADYDAVLTSDGYLLALPVGFSQIRELPYGTEIRYYRDSVLRGLYYSKSVERVSASVYKLSAQSIVGLLSNMQHYGGVYNGTRFSDVLYDVLGNSIRHYSIDINVADTKIYGWLPIATKRDNLHQLLFATGTALSKDANGDPKFVFLDTSSVIDVPSSRIYYGGAVDYSIPASAVEVTEHSFYQLPTDEEIVLFDNKDGSSQPTSTFVEFQDAPIHSLRTEGELIIHEYGVNYAVVSGIGVLIGKKYTHATKIFRKSAETENKENIIRASDVTLVSMLNSENVAKRLFSYYSSKKTVSADIVNEGEKAGQLISFIDPYGEPEMGYLAKMESAVSSILKSQCEIITNYVPEWHGNNFSTFSIYDGDGSFEVQRNGALCILIGGGSGGYSGGDGYSGANSTTRGSFPSPGGAGGVGGSGGIGGKIFAFRIEESGIYQYSCGVGGTGGTSQNGTEPTAGTAGGDTIIMQNSSILASSANGTSSETGYINLISGEVFAARGGAGISGGAGGNQADGNGYGENIVYDATSTFLGGSPGRDRSAGGNTGYGGSGGGAAVGRNGSNGEDGRYTTDTSGATLSYAGKGGAGANAVARTDIPNIYGGGGNGGHGGGGGGAAGTAEGSNSHPQATGGGGGQGGQGSNGANGCIIVFY